MAPSAQVRLRYTTAFSALHAAGVLPNDVTAYIQGAYRCALSAAAPLLCSRGRPARACAPSSVTEGCELR